MQTFTVVLLLVIFVLLALDVFLLYKIQQSPVTRKRNSFDKRYFELKFELRVIEVVATILLLVGTFLGFATRQEIKGDVEKELRGDLEPLQSELEDLRMQVLLYQSALDSLKSEEGQSIENLNDVKREFNLINRKVNQTQEDLKYNTRIYVANNLVFQTNKEEETKTNKYWFKNLRTIYGEKLPDFKTPPLVITQVKEGGVSLIVVDISKEYVELRLSQESLMLYDAELSNHNFDMWIAEPN